MLLLSHNVLSVLDEVLQREHRKGRCPRRYAASALLLMGCCLLLYVFPSWLCEIEKKLRESAKISEPLIIVITPTYERPARFAEMTRLANTLHLIPHLFWIVIEDGKKIEPHVRSILKRSTVPFTYLAMKTPTNYPGRGWYQRSEALRWLRNNSARLTDNYRSGVVYFADDDNSYDTRVFTDYIRNVKKLGMWAVGLSGGFPVEYPLTVNGTVVGFHAWFAGKRKFPVDMAGFAINLKYILNSSTVIGMHCRPQLGPETCFLEDFGFTWNDIEVFGELDEGKREVLVWHTKTIPMFFDKAKYANLPFKFEGYDKRRKYYFPTSKHGKTPIKPTTPRSKEPGSYLGKVLKIMRF
ncbi:Galactosylgalactosylxylosylprotein 3-beta-glucuronosyltransferase [Trichostrongylus colubriformis]|uniref:Galactosylgalactosylxylosylprotein 3-beta-glucuronosyltransferase n=1 Tax=Trichostrongylus colubriformis TaxID=6319 RepID=A0AAN8F2E6_TRICO